MAPGAEVPRASHVNELQCQTAPGARFGGIGLFPLVSTYRARAAGRHYVRRTGSSKDLN